MINLVSVSGGKDSAATLMVAVQEGAEKLRAVFADTGHEHPETYDYVDYLEDFSGVKIERVKADLSGKVIKRREFILSDRCDWPDADKDRALQVLKPTGIPFLDLCLWKGRFPSTKARFCTQFLKAEPIDQQVINPIIEQGNTLISWQGIRRDESKARANALMFDVECGTWEPEPNGWLVYRPIVHWTAADVFNFCERIGLKPNPLYLAGMSRVGCFPCVNARKGELRAMAARYPEEIERVAEWERLVGLASKRGNSTFFYAGTVPGASRINEEISCQSHGIEQVVEWSKTTRGGRHYDLIATSEDPAQCQSVYGLCE